MRNVELLYLSELIYLLIITIPKTSMNLTQEELKTRAIIWRVVELYEGDMSTLEEEAFGDVIAVMLKLMKTDEEFFNQVKDFVRPDVLCSVKIAEGVDCRNAAMKNVDHGYCFL